MKYRFLVLPALCLSLLFACEPDRRTAQGEGYVEEDQGFVNDTAGDYDYGLEVGDTEPTAATGLDFESNQFLAEAARGSKLEVDLAQLAQEKADVQEVQDLAQMLKNDHQQINERLKSLAETKDFAFPEMYADQQEAILEDMRETSAEDFEREYVQTVLQMHEQQIRQFETMIEDVDDQEIRDWMESTLTELRQHKEQAQQVLDQLKE